RSLFALLTLTLFRSSGLPASLGLSPLGGCLLALGALLLLLAGSLPASFRLASFSRSLLALRALALLGAGGVAARLGLALLLQRHLPAPVGLGLAADLLLPLLGPLAPLGAGRGFAALLGPFGFLPLGLQASFGFVELRCRAAIRSRPPAVEAIRRSLTQLALAFPAPLHLALVAGLPVAPRRLALAGLVPTVPVGYDDRPALLPDRRGDPVPAFGERRPMEQPRAFVVAFRREAVAQGRPLAQHAAVAVVDDHHAIAAIAVAVVRVAHEERARRIGGVIVVAVAAVDRLGIARVAVARAPRPRLDAAVVETVVRR